MTSHGSPSSPNPAVRSAGDTARRIARALAVAGVREVVLAPGSRSAPLVYALAPLADAGLIRTHVRIDERDAAFLALGLARGARTARTRRRGSSAEAPVAVITTSGSAVANLHPAVLEASYGNLPLLAITADRPARLRGTGANQTIDDQSQVLSDLRARIDVPAASEGEVDLLIAEALASTVGLRPGPVQLNVQFDVPLVPAEEELEAWVAEVSGLVAPAVREVPRAGVACRVRVDDATVIVAGDAGGYGAEAVAALAAEHRIPILAEPSSTLTSTSEFVAAHALVLGNRADLRGAIRTVIVHGKPTLTRPVAALLADASLTIQHLPDAIDEVGLEVAEGTSGAAEPADSSWLEAWQDAGRTELEAAIASAVGGPEATRVAHGIAAHLAASAITLFAASSNTIRYLSTAPDLRAEIHASRGLAGIDGLVSTATGLSLALGERVVLLIGDIAMLHDVGGLLTPELEPEAHVDIVVLNDDGGAIFAGLEHSRAHLAPYFRRYFTVPHGRDFAGVASAYGWDYRRVTGTDDFIAAVDGSSEAGAAGTTRRLIEVDLRG